jgi:hypothetical protein
MALGFTSKQRQKTPKKTKGSKSTHPIALHPHRIGQKTLQIKGLRPNQSEKQLLANENHLLLIHIPSKVCFHHIVPEKHSRFFREFFKNEWTYIEVQRNPTVHDEKFRSNHIKQCMNQDLSATPSVSYVALRSIPFAYPLSLCIAPCVLGVRSATSHTLASLGSCSCSAPPKLLCTHRCIFKKKRRG